MKTMILVFPPAPSVLKPTNKNMTKHRLKIQLPVKLNVFQPTKLLGGEMSEDKKICMYLCILFFFP